MRLTFSAILAVTIWMVLPAQSASASMLTVRVDGHGQVTSSPAGIHCPSLCSGTFTEVSLRPRARRGFVFTGWTGACSGRGTCNLILDADRAVTARFVHRKSSAGGYPTGSSPLPPPPIASAPPPGATPPVAPPPHRRAEIGEISRILRALPRASIAFNAPSTLSLDESTVVELLLAPDQAVRELKRKVQEIGKRVGARISYSELMEAHLVGSDFTIKPVVAERQVVSESGTTRWAWEVQPTSTGRQRLHLTLTALLDVRGRESPRAIRTFDQTLDIRVSLATRVSDFFGANWQWLWTTILVPLGAWYLARRREQSQPRE